MPHLPASQALARFTVLDLTRVRAGPTCVRQLADWGADVVKIELPDQGPDSHGLGGPRAGSDFQNLHRNKRSLTLNLKAAEGRAILLRLVERADVVVENFRSGVMDRLGLDYETISKRNPQVVYCSIPAFASSDSPKPGYDLLMQALSGLMSLTGTDRPTKAHEQVFLLSKRGRYFFDADAIAEPAINAGRVVEYDGTQKNCSAGDSANDRRTLIDRTVEVGETRNARTVWTIATQPFKEAHFATFPPELARRCIAAGSAHGDTVLDPFAGAGTTGLAADRLGRNFVGVELNLAYARMARERIRRDAPLFHGVEP